MTTADRIRAFLNGDYVKARRYHDPELSKLADLAEVAASELDTLKMLEAIARTEAKLMHIRAHS